MTLYITREIPDDISNFNDVRYGEDVQYHEWETLQDAEEQAKRLRARGLKVEIYRLL